VLRNVMLNYYLLTVIGVQKPQRPRLSFAMRRRHATPRPSDGSVTGLGLGAQRLLLINTKIPTR